MWQDPALAAGELTWRWCFGFSAWVLAITTALLFLDSLTISPADQILISTLQPVLVNTAVHDVFRGSLLRFVWVQTGLLVGVTLLWSFAATAGRSATLARLVEVFREDETRPLAWHFRPMFALNLLRATWSIFGIATAAAALAFGVAMAREQHAARAAFLLPFGIVLACLFAFVLNWFLGLAPLFCVRDSVGAAEAIARAIDFCTSCGGRVLALSLGFLATWMVWAGTMGLFLVAALSLVKYLGVGWVLLLLGLVALVYFAGADLLYLARLGAYAALAEEDPASDVPSTGVEPQGEPASIGDERVVAGG